MAAVLELTPLDLAGHHRQSRRDALQGANAGHLVDRDRAMDVISAGRSPVGLADVGTLGIEGGIGLRGQPITDAMRLEVSLFLKTPHRALRDSDQATSHRFVGNLALAPLADGRCSPMASRRSSQSPRRSVRACMSEGLPTAPHRPAAPTRIARPSPAATAGANTALSWAIRRGRARSRALPHRRPHAASCGPAGPTAAASSEFVPAVPALRVARAKLSQDRPRGA